MVGIDIIEVKRISKALKNEKFLTRVFSLHELEYAKNYKDYSSHLAGFFCAKESVMKALEDCKQLSFLDIEVSHSASGKPYVKLSKKAKKILEDKNCKDIEISISQTKNYATAICVLIKN